MKSSWARLHALATAEVAATLRALPAPLQQRAREVPVTFEPRPNDDLVTEGIELDTLGLFSGPEFGDQENDPSPVPPQIILFLENLWDLAEGDEQRFREESRTTYLHELGHYLGLDEDGLIERGLD